MGGKKASGTQPKEPKLLYVATHLPTNEELLESHSEAMVTAIAADSGTYKTPNPPLADITAANNTLGTAIQQAKGGGTAEKKAVRTAAIKVRQLLKTLGVYVEGVLRLLPPEEVPPKLAAVLMYASKIGNRPPKPPLQASQGKGIASGSVRLVALAILSKLLYAFEWSADGTNWTVVMTGKSRCTISGLTPGKSYWFRVRAFLRSDVWSPYTQEITFMVK